MTIFAAEPLCERRSLEEYVDEVDECDEQTDDGRPDQLLRVEAEKGEVEADLRCIINYGVGNQLRYAICSMITYTYFIPEGLCAGTIHVYCTYIVRLDSTYN